MSLTLTFPRPCQMCHLRLLGDLSELEAKSLDDYRAKKITKRFRKGEVLFREGEPSEGIYCLGTGKVKLYKESPEGRSQILRLAGPGDLLGYQALLSEKPHAATAEALEACELCFIDRGSFRNALLQSPRFNLMLLQKLSRELREAEGLASSLAQKSARARMAELLLTLSAAHGQAEARGTKIALRLSREELAEMIGITQETSIRLLSDFRREGWVFLEERSITILDTPALQALAEG